MPGFDIFSCTVLMGAKWEVRLPKMGIFDSTKKNRKWRFECLKMNRLLENKRALLCRVDFESRTRISSDV